MAASTQAPATQTRLRPWSDRRAAPVALFFLTLLVYLTTLTQVHSFDALSYVSSVERKPWTEVFHPHHLAYGPLGALALAAGRMLGYTGGAALPMQLVNACAGALGVALFFALVRRATGRADVALTSALLLGGTYAYWYYAVEIEVYTVATLFLIVCLGLLARPARSRRRLLALGLAQGGAVLFHQTNVLLCVPIGVMLALSLTDDRPLDSSTVPELVEGQDKRPTKDEGRRTKDEGRRTKDERPFDRLRRDRRSGQAAEDRKAESEQLWSVVPSRSLPLSLSLRSKVNSAKGSRAGSGRWLVYAAALALVVVVPYLFVGVVISGFRSLDAFDAWLTEYARTGWWGGPITAQKWADLARGLGDTLAQPGGALLGLLLVGLLLMHLRQLVDVPRPLLAALVTWLLVYGAFFLWWEPDNIEFWIASLPPAFMLLALALRGERPWGPGIWLALAVAATAVGLNYDAIVRRGDPATDLQRVIARELAARSQPADLLLVPDGLLELYLPYYQHHDNFQSLNQALFDNDDNWDQACAAVQARIDTALHAGAKVFLADEVLRPPSLLLQRHRITPEQVTACFAPYGGALQFVPLPAPVPAYWRLAMGQERAEGGGWRFDRFAQGWQAANVQQELFAQGWHFVPGSDPSLTSPLFNIDAGRFQAIEIRMANGSKARDAQLFFAGPDGGIAEERSARWTLKPTTSAVTYRIELADRPGWQGRITRLRLDPVGVGDGGEIRVEWIRMVRKKVSLGSDRLYSLGRWDLGEAAPPPDPTLPIARLPALAAGQQQVAVHEHSRGK